MPEESGCGKCSMASVCPMKNKVPDAKVTSSKDALLLVYYMALSARYAENLKNEDPSLHGAKADSSVEKLLAEESDKQAAQTEEILGEEDQKRSRVPLKLPPETPMSPDQEFALYLSGIRLLDQMSVLVWNTVQERETLDSLRETQIQEYSTRKKLDQALRIESTIKQTLTKKRDKRQETKGLHDLVSESRRGMEQFSKKANYTEGITSKTEEEPRQARNEMSRVKKTPKAN